MYRGPRVVLWLFNLQASSLGEGALQLRKRQAQDTVCIFCFDLIGIHAGDIKASLIGAIAAFHADHFVLLILFLHFGFPLGPNGQHVIMDVQCDILLLKTGKIGLQQVVIALIGDIGAELIQRRGIKEAAKERKSVARR